MARLTLVVVVVVRCREADGGEYELPMELLNLPSEKVGGVLESRWRKLDVVVVYVLLYV